MTGSEHTQRLLDQARAGNRDALAELLERHGAEVRRRVAAGIGDVWQSALDADDVMQVTYLEAFLRIEQFAGGNADTFVGWLTAIARNNLRDGIRALSRASRPDPRLRVAEDNGDAGVSTRTPSRSAAGHELESIVAAALDQLPPDYARVIRGYDIAGRSAEEVAADLGRSAGAMHMLRARAHQRLADLLGPDDRFFTHVPDDAAS